MGETEKKCFIEEIPDETMVIGKYKTQLFDEHSGQFLPSSPGIGMHVEVKDPNMKVILSKYYASEGRFTLRRIRPVNTLFVFTPIPLAGHCGQEENCVTVLMLMHCTEKLLQCSIQGVVIQAITLVLLLSVCYIRIHLDIQVGEHANDYQEIAAKDKLTELQLRIRQLLDQVEQISREQNYQRFREVWFRMTSESTNQRVLWWALAQTLILLITGFWQMRHLKGFFEAKKLV
ncbi:Transmembrane emp24 domain-containing protein 4 [Desmophyllum pertusum]|uniref:Transmembrane emp24 domain-containing protein 4 n=1 Tax=Desmophyllum pertusum TaxID=174260 RepID=A0A9W9YVR9_9CNID|nr:Transmembrane emp24 domain-containing protein 4 [Desmophyllum pertusum]